MLWKLNLGGLKPRLVTGTKLIFDHPVDPGLLVKVINEDRARHLWGKKSIYKDLRRGGLYTDLLRCLNEYILVRSEAAGEELPIQRVLGIVDTDLGPGLLVEKFADQKGNLAPTLRQFIKKHGFTAETKNRLDAFIDEIIRHNVIVNDLNSGNILIAPETSGGTRLVLVDGFGEKTWVTYCSASKTLNRLNTQRHYRKLLHSISLSEKERAVRPQPA